LKLWVLGWQQAKNFGSHILAFHRWIRFLFGYIIMLNVTYILTRACFVWGLSPEEHFWKITLQDSLVCRLLYHLFTVGLVCIVDMLFIQMLYKFEMVKIGNNHSYQKLYFLNSRSPIFRSVWYCSDIERFNHWMYVNFGYVILMMMMYNSTIWIYWILNLQNDVLSLVWEILNENMRFSIKSMFWD